MKKYALSAATFLAATLSYAQLPGEDTFIHYETEKHGGRNEICIPNIDGYLTLKGDFHIHTIFSDGEVTPSYRVSEARNNGLDIIAITDHIEYRPKEYISKKVTLNTPYELALEATDGDDDIIVIHGIEISRSKPFGHMNALFIDDAEKADLKDDLEALNAMVEQGAYIIWNHPGWPDDKCTMYPLHEKLIAEGKIHGFEVWNDIESYPLSYDWVSEYGLHPFANSDIHGTISDRYAGTRPLTLVFAKERTHDSVKEAMFAGRVLALFNNFLMGKEEFIAPLVKECLSFQLREDKGDYCIYNVVNNSDIRFQLQIGNTLHQVTLNPHSQTYVEVAKNHDVTFVNCILGIGKYYSAHQSEL